MYIIKEDLTKQKWNPDKIINAVKKAADRALVTLTEQEISKIIELVYLKAQELSEDNSIKVSILHNVVENSLLEVNEKVSRCYVEYRNYKINDHATLEKIYKDAQSIMYLGDKENSNTDSSLVATRRSLVYNTVNTELFKKFFLNVKELKACKDGYIYIHDMSARRDTMNCCLFNVENVLRGGFEMGNIWYNEPKTLDTAFDVIGDIVLSAAGQQYGGFTVAEVDKLLEPYALKSYEKHKQDHKDIVCSVIDYLRGCVNPIIKMMKALHLNGMANRLEGLFSWSKHKQHFGKLADSYATKKVAKEFKQGFQGWEYKFNTVGSSRGDYPFISMSLGLGISKFSRLASKLFLDVRGTGQGKEGLKKPVLFPKLIFLYDEELHGKGKELEDVFEAGIECSSKAMYPDWLSLSGEGYVPEMYKKYGTPISPMGCRAFLSPWYQEGGMSPAHVGDKPVFVGRFNIGAASLNLPMIYAKAQRECVDFYEVLDYYLEMIRKLHLRTYEYLGEMRASCNPLAYCEGGFYGGNLKPSDKIKPLLESATASFGITALNELEQLANKDSVYNCGSFSLEVMEYINTKLTKFKKEDGRLYAVYGTPAESLCGKQVDQFRKIYGIVPNVSDKTYVSNSFHCHVSEDISPIQKQDSEKRFWNLFDGGKIQHVKFHLGYNLEAIRVVVRRGMELGFYCAVNLSLSHCNDCGHKELAMEKCPKCGSMNLTQIERMNGYLSYKMVSGASRLNDAKLDEIADRKSM